MITGAEASIIFKKNIVIKKRIDKKYRVKELNDKLINSRTKREVKILKKLQNIINVPKLITSNKNEIVMEKIDGKELSEIISKKNYKKIGEKIGKIISKIHKNNIIHGDLTTSNMILNDNDQIFLIDFGLSFVSHKEEDKAVDLHLLHQSVEAKHFDFKDFFEIILKKYEEENLENKKIIKRLSIVEKRGRNK